MTAKQTMLVACDAGGYVFDALVRRIKAASSEHCEAVEALCCEEREAFDPEAEIDLKSKNWHRAVEYVGAFMPYFLR